MNEVSTRVRLVEAAARLLAGEGPKALSARRLATEVGASTMAVYTHFGGMPELVREVVREGFARLAEHLGAVSRTDDPVADLGLLAVAYRANALANPHLYEVMLGSPSVSGSRLTDDESAIGLETFEVLVEASERAMAAGRFRPGDPLSVSAQLWSALHGFVTLELAGHFPSDDYVEGVFAPMLETLARGLGDDPEATSRSIAIIRASLDR